MSAQPTAPPRLDADALIQAEAAADGATATLRLAAALATAGRAIDLGGLDNEIGRLCAGLLDLPPEAGRRMRPRLIALLAELDRLVAAMPQP
jgi:hypothetical protein